YVTRPSLVITPAPGAVARFTDDGSPVTTASPQYTTPITISLSRQIRSASDLSGTLSAENIINLAVDQNSIAIPRNSLSLW
ncbi:chitobiase/beta-hexosaminidase C-terminal domain-containing protein, partial [Vibrio cholerae]|uniref:chitobiase/beta-hexosaminidase C-terminal domain-containing protein n=1 Tax=Vibrio cholerae TaxID=666 RepID=UPI00301DDD88